jgi:hypothetical protein
MLLVHGPESTAQENKTVQLTGTETITKKIGNILRCKHPKIRSSYAKRSGGADAIGDHGGLNRRRSKK